MDDFTVYGCSFDACLDSLLKFLTDALRLTVYLTLKNVILW